MNISHNEKEEEEQQQEKEYLPPGWEEPREVHKANDSCFPKYPSISLCACYLLQNGNDGLSNTTRLSTPERWVMHTGVLGQESHQSLERTEPQDALGDAHWRPSTRKPRARIKETHTAETEEATQS